eukprot:1381220-Pleurochrysis_carterae.AAC.2
MEILDLGDMGFLLLRVIVLLLVQVKVVLVIALPCSSRGLLSFRSRPSFTLTALRSSLAPWTLGWPASVRLAELTVSWGFPPFRCAIHGAQKIIVGSFASTKQSCFFIPMSQNLDLRRALQLSMTRHQRDRVQWHNLQRCASA